MRGSLFMYAPRLPEHACIYLENYYFLGNGNTSHEVMVIKTRSVMMGS